MPPTLSDADRFSGDDDDDNGNDNINKSANNNSSSSFILHVPRSTHREMVSNTVQRVSRDMPGFRDWRGSSKSSRSKSRDDKEYDEDVDKAAVVVELDFATRRRLNRSSSPGVVGVMRVAGGGGSEKGKKSRRVYQQVPSSKSQVSRSSSSSSIPSTDHRDNNTEFVPRPRERRRREKKHRASATAVYSPTSSSFTKKKEDVPSSLFDESETTMKFDNTQTATVIKYRAAYEEILESIETLERFERSISNNASETLSNNESGRRRLSESSCISQQDEGKDDKVDEYLEDGICSLVINNTNCNNNDKDVNAALRRSLLRYVDEITAGITLHGNNYDDEGGGDDGMPALSSNMVINHEALVKKGVDDLLQSLILKTKEQAGTNAKENHSSMREAKSPSRGHRDEPRRDFGEIIKSRDAWRSSSSRESRRRSSSRTSSSSNIEDDHASVSSQRSSKSILSHLSYRSQQSNRSQRSSKSNRSNRSSSKDKQSTPGNVNMGNKQQQQPTNKMGGGGIFQRIKNLAGKVKTTLGVTGVHKFQLGESARYKTLKVKNKSWMIAEGTYDVETLTAAVDIVAVHIDAVLEMPYYTVQLSDGSLKRTNWDKLMTLSDYKKLKSLAAASDKVDGKIDDDHLVSSGSTRDASAGRLRNMARRFSSPFRERSVDTTGMSVNDEDTALSGSINSSHRQKQVEQDGDRKRRNHNSSQRRNSSRRRSSSKELNSEEDVSTSKASSRRSSRSSKGGTGGSRPIISQIQGDAKSSRSSRGGRPRSQSPFTRDRQCRHSTSKSQQPHSFHAASKSEFQAPPVRNESSSTIVVEGRSSSPLSITTERISSNLEIATKPLTRKHSVVVVEDVTDNESMMW
jgi:hypothetical protein